MQLKNAEIPVYPQDMATKVYVDALETKLDEMENLLVSAGLYDTKDVEGNLYHAVKIGNQIWMDENLRTTKYNDGHEIPCAVIIGSQYPDTAAYCWLGNNQATYGGTYGPLYNYYTVETGKLCPVGWHVPVKAEWDALAVALGGKDVAGGKMKEAGTLHWTAPNTAATNESGFTALPGGELSTYSSHGGTGFQNYRVVACWWSASTEEGIATAYYNSCIHGSLTHFTRDKSYAVNVRCIRGEYPDIRPPVVTTSMVTEIFQNTATSGGVITDDGGSAIIARGICWSTLPNPDINSFRPNGIHTYDGYGPGEFTSQVTGLTKQKTYYVRAYAVTKTDTVYGNVQTFVPQLAFDSITDIDGNTYKTIEIGTQTWMAENLKVTRYSNGDAIATPLSLSAQNNGAYSNYGNDTSIAAVYGRLYNWYTTVDPRGLCPSGWHVPDFEDWSDLIFGLGSYQIAGIKLKETGTSHWINNTGTETNESGFTALPGGWWNGAFSGSGTHAYFWSSTILDGKPYHWMIHDDIINMSESLGAREDGCSVRCIKD